MRRLGVPQRGGGVLRHTGSSEDGITDRLLVFDRHHSTLGSPIPEPIDPGIAAG